MHSSVIYPFLARIAKRTKRSATGCLEWTGSTVGRGYGKMTIDKKSVRAHRAMWEHHNGPIPAGLGVLHKCDNPPCVEINHLFLGTDLDNATDRTSKGRTLRGEQVGTSKFSDDQVTAAKKLLGSFTQREIAKRFGISRTHMSRIARDQSRHISPVL